MDIVTKLLIAAALLAGTFYAGYRYRKPEIVTQTKVQIKEVEKVVIKKVTEKTTKPDGTVTEKIIERETKHTETKEQGTHAVVLPKKSWSVGLVWPVRFEDMDYTPSGAELGYRVIGDVWTTVQYDWTSGNIAAGIRLEF